jgi:hypothetical protein
LEEWHWCLPKLLVTGDGGFQAVSHATRKLGGQQCTAEEIRAIEERTAELTREHFENEPAMSLKV